MCIFSFGLFPLDFLTKLVCPLLISPFYAACPYVTFLDLIIIICGKGYKLCIYAIHAHMGNGKCAGFLSRISASPSVHCHFSYICSRAFGHCIAVILEVKGSGGRVIVQSQPAKHLNHKGCCSECWNPPPRTEY